MPTLEFVQIDVFTDRAFSGNQLAVFPDGRGLSTHQMQTLAREMNFSETTFVLPAEEAGSAARVRIFTTTKEMPMAGHPTIGTALVLMQRGLLKNNRAVFELNIGPTTIEIDHNTGGSLPLVWMTQGLPHFGDIRTDHETVAARLDLSVADLMDLP